MATHRRSDHLISHLADWINPIVRGWMNHYGAFYRSALYPLLGRINAYLLRWVRRKYKRLRGSRKARTAWNNAIRKDRVPSPTGLGSRTPPRSGDQSDKSRITGDCYVRFCEGPGVRSPRATRRDESVLNGVLGHGLSGGSICKVANH
ncbi:group II intron maturase-specific domain-containing protein [Rhizomonospora bruguierae]|uniref:group II intron maturase-specific domain-containing protein n=1 Tax=Rhizomonospora bruguierae TaxID=1581705 RepID=UPI0035E41AC1